MNKRDAGAILYGICQWSMPELDPEAAAQAVRGFGLDGIELDAGSWDGVAFELADPGLQARWSEACAAHSLQIPALAVNALCGSGMSNPEKRDEVSAMLAGGVKIARALNVPVLQLPSFFDGAIKSRQQLETTAEQLRGVCDLAAVHGIAVGTENALSVALCRELFTLVDRGNLKFFFDTQNPWAMERLPSLDILKGLYADLYPAVHVKDGRGDELSSALLGEGDSGFAETVAFLVENNYSGWAIIENDYRQQLVQSGWEQNAAADVAMLRQVL